MTEASPAERRPSVAVASEPSADWDAFVREQPGASTYFQSGWSLLARDVFRHRVMFMEARDETGRLIGVLPLVQQRSLLGNFATSIPFFNYGGALATTAAARRALMDRARELGRELGCSYVELRDTNPDSDAWSCRTDKVTMILDLPGDDATLAKQLGSKLRSQIKRSERESPAVRVGGAELVADFYSVFAHNMRDLGTPVYPRRFFRAIVERFPHSTQIVVVDRNGVPAAAAFLVFDGARAEIPWAACREEAKPLGFNMKLYWEVLSLVIARGCTSFDFGRSTVDSGTYRFKKQWGAKPVQLYWHRWERHARGGSGSTPSRGRLTTLLSQVWCKLPVPVANVVGPLISPGLPW